MTTWNGNGGRRMRLGLGGCAALLVAAFAAAMHASHRIDREIAEARQRHGALEASVADMLALGHHMSAALGDALADPADARPAGALAQAAARFAGVLQQAMRLASGNARAEAALREVAELAERLHAVRSRILGQARGPREQARSLHSDEALAWRELRVRLLRLADSQRAARQEQGRWAIHARLEHLRLAFSSSATIFLATLLGVGLALAACAQTNLQSRIGNVKKG